MSGYISLESFVSYPAMFICTIILIMVVIKLYQITYNFIFRRNIHIPCGYDYLSSKIWNGYHDLLLGVSVVLVLTTHLLIVLCFDVFFGVWGGEHTGRYIPVWCAFYFVLLTIPLILRSIVDLFLGKVVKRGGTESQRKQNK